VRPVSFDRIADRYDTTRGGEARGRFVAAVLKPWLPTEGLVGEIGVGTAVVATPLRASGRSVVGFDISAAMLRVGAGRYSGPLVRADVATLPVRDGAFAAVYAVWVLHLVGDVAPVLAECHRALRPGGRLIAVVDDATRRIADERFLRLERRYRRRVDHIDVLDPLVLRAGFRRRRVESIAPFRRPTSPAELAAHLEARTWSWLWTIPDDVWDAEVVQLIEALRSTPDADRPEEQQVANQLVVWDR
jgi:SAM-dependent methyltransferase